MRRTTVKRACLTLSNRPVIMVHSSLLKVWDRAVHVSGAIGPLLRCPLGRGDQMATANDDLLDCPLYSVTLRLELALLKRPLDKDVVTLVEGRRYQRKIPVE